MCGNIMQNNVSFSYNFGIVLFPVSSATRNPQLAHSMTEIIVPSNIFMAEKCCDTIQGLYRAQRS